MTDLGKPNKFLGLNINYDVKSDVIKLNQSDYITVLLNKFGMGECRPVATPMEIDFVSKLCMKNCDLCNQPYRELVGAQLYITQISRPDIMYPINVLSRFQNNLDKEKWVTLKHVL